MAAEASGGVGVHVLDDGFQHRRLGRDLDVVLLTKADVEDELLPAGNLREEMGALGRADVVVLREEEAAGTAGVGAGGEGGLGGAAVLGFGGQVPEKVVVFCGIARPEGFLGMLEDIGVIGTGVVKFKDHHRYEMRDVEMLAGMGRLGGVSGLCDDGEGCS